MKPSEPQPCARDEHWMRLALQGARVAAAQGEVPVGAVVVRGDEWLAAGWNSPVAGHDPTAHAEIRALRDAARVLGNYRLDGCTLYVTLEPCLMCAGAMLHARLARVVFGAVDPKTGAGGSVLDVFGDKRLNHQTQVCGGVLAHDCSVLLQEFFADRRSERRARVEPLREDALRTPEACFAALDGAEHARYVRDLPALDGLRLHYEDWGSPGAPTGWLLVHGPRGWSLEWRHLAAALAELGQRVIVPDLIGFGRSDKLKKEAAYSLQGQAGALAQLLRRLGMERVVLVVPGSEWARALATRLQPLCVGTQVVPEPVLTPQAADAPYPDAGHRAGQRALARRQAHEETERAVEAASLTTVQALGLPTAFTFDGPEDARLLARRAVEYFAL
ncbi:MAG: tRNA adenosine(34) deaminase TadA [Comamonas sp.]|nr:tRNA adenosine(34) deaminase TadA [Comamonas sp.]